MRTLFSPAIFLLNRLAFPKKFALVSLIGFVAIAIPIGILLGEFIDAMGSARSKLEGTELIQPINKAIQQLQQHRGLSSGLLSGSQELAPKRAAKQQDVEAALAGIQAALSQELKESAGWQTIRSEWKTIVDNGLSLPVAENTATHTRLIDNVLTFMTATTDATGLTFDPQPDIHFLVETAVLRQPVVLERLGRLRALGTGVLAQKAIGEQQKINISIQLAELRGGQRAFESNLDKIAKVRPELAAQLKTNSEQFKTTSGQLLKVINEEVLTANAGMAPAAYFDQATQVIDIGYALFYEQLIPALKSSVKARQESQRNTMILILAVALAAGAACFYLTVGTAIAIIESVRRVRENANIIASGNLLARVAIDSQDELKEIATAVNDIAAAFQHLIRGIQHGIHEVSKATEHLTASSHQIHQSAAAQSDAASGMAAAIEEMTVGVDQISYNAQEAHRISSDSGKISSTGGQMVGNVVKEIERIAESVSTSAKSIEDLGRHSDRISTVVNVIKDIADQTNLLALNAAIEAARAGESGRGFAVVADEVRKLAERTAKSTSEIAGMIDAIQQGAQEAVGSMGSGVERVNGGVELAREAGNAMHSIEDGAHRVVTVVSDISTSLREQSAAASEIAKNVEHIAQMAEENSAAAGANAATAERLDQLTEKLQADIDKFTV
jgi:methyl-accepting chemotaxis protein